MRAKKKTTPAKKPVKFLTREQILNAKDIIIEEVDVPEWGGVVRIRSMNGEEAVKYVTEFKNKTDDEKEAQAVKIVTFCAVDENGERLFNTEEDLAPLRRKSFAAIIRLQGVAMRLAGMKIDKGEVDVKND